MKNFDLCRLIDRYKYDTFEAEPIYCILQSLILERYNINELNYRISVSISKGGD
jgi:hypothetical protein